MKLSGPLIDALLGITAQARITGGWAVPECSPAVVRALERRGLLLWAGGEVVELTAKGWAVVGVFGQAALLSSGPVYLDPLRVCKS